MKSGDSVYRSPLNKPLYEITEEDISQLTREDCRKYLKDKGMRRPSWNKSQAIQQVISLKKLLESKPVPGDDADVGKRPELPQPELEVPSHIEPTASESVSDRSTYPLQQQSSASSDAPFPALETVKGSLPFERSVSPRMVAANSGSGDAKQMTIFYDGRVKVYDGVPLEKARLIMQIAEGSPSFMPEDATTAAARIIPSTMLGMVSPPVSVGVPTTVHTQTEGRTCRKASLLRYFEKKKDRFTQKRKRSSSSSFYLETPINHQVKTQASNGHLSRSSTSSPTLPKPPHTPTRCSSVENLPENHSLSVDLNDDGDYVTCQEEENNALEDVEIAV